METVPVNAASELRKRPPSLYASSKGNVMQKAKVECACVCVCEDQKLLDLHAPVLLFPGVGVKEGDIE